MNTWARNRGEWVRSGGSFEEIPTLPFQTDELEDEVTESFPQTLGNRPPVAVAQPLDYAFIPVTLPAHSDVDDLDDVDDLVLLRCWMEPQGAVTLPEPPTNTPSGSLLVSLVWWTTGGLLGMTGAAALVVLTAVVATLV